MLCAQGVPPAEGSYPQDGLLADVRAAEGKTPGSLVPSLVSGAGHDAVAMAELTKVRTAVLVLQKPALQVHHWAHQPQGASALPLGHCCT